MMIRMGWILFVPVAAHELVAEVDANLRDVVVAGEDECAHEIVAAVAARLEAGDLKKHHLEFGYFALSKKLLDTCLEFPSKHNTVYRVTVRPCNKLF